MIVKTIQFYSFLYYIHAYKIVHFLCSSSWDMVTPGVLLEGLRGPLNYPQVHDIRQC